MKPAVAQLILNSLRHKPLNERTDPFSYSVATMLGAREISKCEAKNLIRLRFLGKTAEIVYQLSCASQSP